mgnify:CR=1 FL=1
MRGAQLLRQARMIGQGRPALLAQPGGGFFYLLARQAIDNAGVPLVLAQKTEQLLTGLILGHDAIKNIGAIKAGNKAGSLLQFQPLELGS